MNRDKLVNNSFAVALAVSIGAAAGSVGAAYNSYNDVQAAEEAIDTLEFYAENNAPELSEVYEAKVDLADESKEDLMFHLGNGAAFVAGGVYTLLVRRHYSKKNRLNSDPV
jgi:hypothetical protein